MGIFFKKNEKSFYYLSSMDDNNKKITKVNYCNHCRYMKKDSDDTTIFCHLYYKDSNMIGRADEFREHSSICYNFFPKKKTNEQLYKKYEPLTKTENHNEVSNTGKEVMVIPKKKSIFQKFIWWLYKNFNY